MTDTSRLQREEEKEERNKRIKEGWKKLKEESKFKVIPVLN
jgi:hypothetical protein